VTLTITFVVLMYNILDVSPVVFLKLAQDQVGESDFIYTKVASVNTSETGDIYMYSDNVYQQRKSKPKFTLPFVN